MIDVEVPEHGTVVVEDGNVYGIESNRTDYVPCYCIDDMHRIYDRTHPTHGVPHIVGVTVVKHVWAPRPTTPGDGPQNADAIIFAE